MALAPGDQIARLNEDHALVLAGIALAYRVAYLVKTRTPIGLLGSHMNLPYRARADVLCVKDEDMPLWLSVTRVQMSLAMKLRLTPSTRMRDKRNAAPLAPLPRPWETRDAAS